MLKHREYQRLIQPQLANPSANTLGKDRIGLLNKSTDISP